MYVMHALFSILTESINQNVIQRRNRGFRKGRPLDPLVYLLSPTYPAYHIFLLNILWDGPTQKCLHFVDTQATRALL